MILMINGAFGVGKTCVANELIKIMDNSMIFDPEEVGFMLRNILRQNIKQVESTTGDFQEFHLWKVLTVETAKLLVATYQKTLVVPMTIREPEYFRYIFNGFKMIDEQTIHFCLTAKEETIFNRLRKRGEAEGNWCFRQTKKCIESFQENDFSIYIDTEHTAIDKVAQVIKKQIDHSTLLDENGL
ncbi:AAA family ATPase [Virgibacillus salarius]|uniref:AAA family ATPase n=1 Tax=Virgibacillus TaxID=84406 RepID=UPI002491993A|nr:MULTISPECIES: AAA family ATPase [Virgibacillus]MDY7044150.1 AAA family ATPase [Virgibacillus sp. M23]WBX82129.1 AAA family ATPase [Virgibacillus salarius]